MLKSICLQLHMAVCDDERIDREQIICMTREVLQKEEIPCDISGYGDCEELLAAIQSGVKFHILLLDVMMEGLNGMELAAALRRLEDNTAIIFISSNRDMAMHGYEVAALRYLEKPVDWEQLHEALVFCNEMWLKEKEILLPTASGQSRVVLSDIIYAETWERGIRLTLKDGQKKVKARISDIAAVLPERQFVFCHRTIIVNLAFVQSIRYCELELKSGETLPISKYRQSEMKKKFIHYLDR